MSFSLTVLKCRGRPPPSPDPVQLLSGKRLKERVWQVVRPLVKTGEQLVALNSQR